MPDERADAAVRGARRREGGTSRARAAGSGSRLGPYWTCQLVGWSLTGLIMGTIPTLYAGLRWVVVARAIVGAILGIILTDQLRRYVRRRGWLRLPLRRLVLRIVGASATLAVASMLLLTPLLLVIIPPPDRAGPLAAIFAGHAALYAGWMTIYVGVHYLRGLRAAEAERLRVELAMQDAELRALRAQLNPHFLFNSLNSLRGLVAEDPARARNAITGLAALLRYSLQLSRAPTTPLERELEATRHYLELEALRFEARLQYRIDVEPRALDHPVPPMLVQTLVENAIKHGIARRPAGGVVRVEAWKVADDLQVRVTNTGTLDEGGDARGIGLANSLERLRLLFGPRAAIDLVASGRDEVTCEVMVPSPTSHAPPEASASPPEARPEVRS